MLTKATKANKESDRHPAPAHTPIPDDWTEMSNVETAPKYPVAPIRRSDARLKHMHSEQWSITPTVVQKLSGSNANRVKEYLETPPKVEQRLKKYNQDYGWLSAEQGEGSPTRVSEVAC